MSPWTKMMVDSEAATWVWNNLYAPQQTGEPTSYKDQLQQKFQQEDAMKEMKRKQELTKRGYQINR